MKRIFSHAFIRCGRSYKIHLQIPHIQNTLINIQTPVSFFPVRVQLIGQLPRPVDQLIPKLNGVDRPVVDIRNIPFHQQRAGPCRNRCSRAGSRHYLRKNYPYHKSLQEGSIVQAGDVIGYLGRTGYSRTENTNNIDEPHLHFGIQLIFDESQKDGNNEIWIDCYELVKFLAINRAETVKNQETKEYYRVYQMIDPVIPGRPMEQRLPEKSPEVEESIVPEESQKSEEDTKEETKPEETITQESETA